MRIEADSVLQFPRARVYRAYRDEIAGFTAHLPNVRQIEERSREQKGSVIEIFNVWHGGGDIPAALRSVIDESLLSWDDHARWLDDEWTVEWRIRTHAFSEAISCAGKTLFVELGPTRTRLDIRGEFVLDARKVRGVPGFLASSISKTVETFLVRQITANLASVSGALSTYLASALE